jgi:hypothetical protein
VVACIIHFALVGKDWGYTMDIKMGYRAGLAAHCYYRYPLYIVISSGASTNCFNYFFLDSDQADGPSELPM